MKLNKLYLEICKSWAISPAGITDFTNMCTVLNDQVTTIADSYRLYVGEESKPESRRIRHYIFSSGKPPFVVAANP
ncbi:hypothetical protein YC2023_056849 [Brassica napus]